MCKKVVFVLVMVIACVLTGCSKKGTVSDMDDTFPSYSSLQNNQDESISEQPDKSVLANKYNDQQISQQLDKSVLAEKYNVDGDGNVLNLLSTINIPYKAGENYEIYTDETQMYFCYKVKDDSGDLLDEGYTNFRGLDIYQKNGLLVLYRSGSSVSYSERYYDVSAGRVSQFFSRPVAMSDKLVAFFTSDRSGQIKLIVQDIFDRSVYYTEIQRDFSDFVFKDNKYKGEFIDNNTKLRITYPVGYNGETITEDISLN